MKFIKKFNENNSITNIVGNVEDMLYDISDDFETDFDWQSDGLDDLEIDITIHSNEFISEKEFSFKKYLNNFFDIASNNNNNIDNLVKYHNEMIIIYNKIVVFTKRLKAEYVNSSYNISQKNENKSIIKIKIYIPKDETE